jgi:hypothetical protein
MKVNEFVSRESWDVVNKLEDLQRTAMESANDREKISEIVKTKPAVVEALVRRRVIDVLKKFVPHLRDEDYQAFYDEYITHKHLEMIKTRYEI